MLTSRLKEARLRAGLSQERLGTLAGLDEMSASSRMNQYERGKHTPGFFLIERLAQALHMPTPWFYTRDDDMAELLLAYNVLPPALREKALSYIRELATAHGTEDGAADGAVNAATHGGGPSEPAPGSATYSRSSPAQSPSRTPAQPPLEDGRNRK
jgi:transcriptional regulator with XRE-family HTH domain